MRESQADKNRERERDTQISQLSQKKENMLQSVLIFFSTNPCLGIQYVSWNEIKLPQYSDGKPEWNTSKTLRAPVW